MAITIEIIGDYDAGFEPHIATDAALNHAKAFTRIEAVWRWLPTQDLESQNGMERLENADGLLVAPGSPYRNMHGVLQAIRFAREQGRPLLATCGGFQHVIIEYARNVLGFADAQHAEYDPYASRLFISKLTCSLVGRTLPISLQPDSLTAELYETTEVEEQYYCNFGVNPDYVPLLRSGPLKIVGSDVEGEIRVVELANHPFFVGTLFVPQLRSSESAPHPLILNLLKFADQFQKARTHQALD